MDIYRAKAMEVESPDPVNEFSPDQDDYIPERKLPDHPSVDAFASFALIAVGIILLFVALVKIWQ